MNKYIYYLGLLVWLSPLAGMEQYTASSHGCQNINPHEFCEIYGYMFEPSHNEELCPEIILEIAEILRFEMSKGEWYIYALQRAYMLYTRALERVTYSLPAAKLLTEKIKNGLLTLQNDIFAFYNNKKTMNAFVSAIHLPKELVHDVFIVLAEDIERYSLTALHGCVMQMTYKLVERYISDYDYDNALKIIDLIMQKHYAHKVYDELQSIAAEIKKKRDGFLYEKFRCESYHHELIIMLDKGISLEKVVSYILDHYSQILPGITSEIFREQIFNDFAHVFSLLEKLAIDDQIPKEIKASMRAQALEIAKLCVRSSWPFSVLVKEAYASMHNCVQEHHHRGAVNFVNLVDFNEGGLQK